MILSDYVNFQDSIHCSIAIVWTALEFGGNYTPFIKLNCYVHP